jgi:hypothetical protein
MEEKIWEEVVKHSPQRQGNRDGNNGKNRGEGKIPNEIVWLVVLLLHRSFSGSKLNQNGV